MRTKAFYRRLFLILVTIAGLYFFYRVRIIFMPFAFAFFITYLLDPPVTFIQKKGVPKGTAILLVYLVVFCISAAVVVFGFPSVTGELNRLGMAIPKLDREIEMIINTIETRYSQFALPAEIRQIVDERIRHYEGSLLETVRSGTNYLTAIFSYLLGLLIAPVFAFYILKDIEQIKESLVRTIPRRYRSDVMAVGRDINEIISSFIKGHLCICVTVGVITGVGMLLIGHQYALIIGVVAGVAELVPFLGPIITALPAFTLGLLSSKYVAVYALLVILAVQQLENAVLSPKILGRSMGLHPLVVIFALLAGGEIFGFIGVVLAVPAAAVIKIVLRYIYLKLVDGEEEPA